MSKIKKIFIFGSVFFLGILILASFSSAMPTVAEIISEIDKTLEDRLNLTPKQRATIESELANQKAQRKQLADKEKNKKEAIETEMAKDTIDTDAIDTLTAELNSVREDVILLRKNTMKKIKDVLTAEQIVILEDIKVDQLKKLEPPEDTISVKFYSVVCDDEATLPNWSGKPMIITEAEIDNFVSAHPTCDYSSGWTMEWGDQNVNFLNYDYIGEAPGGSGWVTSDATGGVNGVEMKNIDIEAMSAIKFRAVMQAGYYPFSGGSDESAEFYCYDDVLDYDNQEMINGPVSGSIYECVLFTSPK